VIENKKHHGHNHKSKGRKKRKIKRLYAYTAYDLMAYFALRPELYSDAVADIEPKDQTDAP
jgi:hypothetical protein